MNFARKWILRFGNLGVWGYQKIFAGIWGYQGTPYPPPPHVGGEMTTLLLKTVKLRQTGGPKLPMLSKIAVLRGWNHCPCILK